MERFHVYLVCKNQFIVHNTGCDIKEGADTVAEYMYGAKRVKAYNTEVERSFMQKILQVIVHFIKGLNYLWVNTNLFVSTRYDNNQVDNNLLYSIKKSMFTLINMLFNLFFYGLDYIGIIMPFRFINIY